MEKFIVNGGNQLHGSIKPAGNKNEALPVLAAVLMAGTPIIVHNLPNIGDIKTMRSLLEELGASISFKGNGSYQFDATQLISPEPNQHLSQSIRGSFLLTAPLLYRFGYVKIFLPGGDSIGRRRLDTHLQALEQMGVEIQRETNYFTAKCKQFKAAEILLDEASVMATEQVIMAAAVAKGKSKIYNAACEPHVQGLCRLLNAMGAKIKGIGSNLLEIEGVKELGGAEHTISPDHTEIGSLIGLAAVTKSELTIENVQPETLGLTLHYFERLGVRVHSKNGNLIVPADQEMIIKNDIDQSIPKIDDGPWPGFPADLTSIMTVVATQCTGTILIFEKMFESRLFWVDKLISMGARIILCDPHRAVVVGPANLRGAVLMSPDIRAGMALFIAALCAEGKSEIYNIHQIDRGYERIDERLKALGADIQRVSS